MNIKLIKGIRNFIFYLNNYTSNGKNLNKKHIALSMRNKQIAFSSNLRFQILSFSSYVGTKTMNISFSDVETNKSKILGLKQNK